MKSVYFLSFLLFSALVQSKKISSSNRSNTINSLTLNKDQCSTLANKYRPLYIFDKDEQYWPQEVEDLGVDWSQGVKYDEDMTLTFSTKGETFNSNAPVYVSCKTIDTNKIRITYDLLYAFNGCGPTLKIKVKAFGKTIVNGDKSVCPLGQHYLDNERIHVEVAKSSLDVTKVGVAYHSWIAEYSKSEVEWSGNSPVIYVAKGSHASYVSGGKNAYHEILDKRKRKAGVTVYDIDMYLYDSNDEGKNFKPRVKILKVEGEMISGLSTAEKWHFDWCRFKIGKTLTFSRGASAAFDAMNDAGRGLKKVGLKNLGNNLIDSADDLDEEYNQGSPTPCVAKKDWWDDY